MSGISFDGFGFEQPGSLHGDVLLCLGRHPCGCFKIHQLPRRTSFPSLASNETTLWAATWDQMDWDMWDGNSEPPRLLCSWVVHCGFVPVPPFLGAPCLSAYQSWLNLLSYRSLFWRSRRVGSKGIASVQRRRNRSSLHFRTAELRPALHRTLCRNHSKWFVAKELGGAMAIKRLCTCHGIECWNGHAWNSWIFDVFVLLSAIRVPP